MPFIFSRAALTALTLCTPAAVLGQTVLSGDYSVDGSLCVGDNCTNSETFFGSNPLKIKSQNTGIYFEDTSSSGFPLQDWEIVINDDFTGGADYFAIRDVSGGVNPFRIDDSAPANSVYVANDGKVGLGTSLPQSPLHVNTPGDGGIRLNRTSTTTGPAQAWGFQIGEFGRLFFRNFTSGAQPFLMTATAPAGGFELNSTGIILNRPQTAAVNLRYSSGTNVNAFFIEGDNGFVGLGTALPEEVLHIRTDAMNTDAFALFDAAGSGSDAAFRLRQQGTVPTTWEFRNQQSSGRLNVGIAGGNTPFKIDDAANNNLLRLGLNGQPGVVSVTGELRVNNTTMNVPDYVFGDDYALRPLADVQAFIDTHQHLPEVPSAAVIAQDGVGVTQMQMALLKKVEELTLYTLDQQALITAQQARLGQVEAQLAALLSETVVPSTSEPAMAH